MPRATSKLNRQMAMMAAAINRHKKDVSDPVCAAITAFRIADPHPDADGSGRQANR